jgi:hypothetical protein
MKKTLVILSACLQMVSGAVFAAEDPLLSDVEPTHIFVNNRILAQVNGKSISVVDVMKKIDMMFYKQFPQYTASVPARYQFYQLQWKRVLQEFIDKELILADAEEAKVEVNSGDVRQEMEHLFGPNIVMNLDKVGLSFEEAWSMVKEDIIFRKMMGYRVHAKALRRVTPAVVRAYYDANAQNNPRSEQWIYIVISLRSNDQTLGAEAANFVHKLLVEEKKPITEMPEKVREISQYKETIKVTISDTFRHGEQDLSAAYKQALTDLTKGSYSKPIAQKSKSDKSTVYRIFYLQEHHESGIIPFSEVEGNIRNQLLEMTVDEETEAYLNKLHKHYHVDEGHLESLTPDDFAPFILK